jgi:hypothetical protein
MKDTCMICGKRVKKDKRFGRGYACNGAVVGEYIKLTGHPACIDAVDNLVVTPNRIRVSGSPWMNWAWSQREKEGQKKEVVN